MKICSKCKIEKNLSEFSKNKIGKNGYSYYCKECVNKYTKKWYEKNKEHCKKISKKWYEKNKEQKAKYGRIYRKNNEEKISQNRKKYYIENKEQFIEYYKNNKKRIIKSKRKYGNSKTNYDTYASQISWAKDPIRSIDGFLQVKCTYCGKWYFPTTSSIQSRIKALNGQFTKGSESRLYCSEECKEACPIYAKHLYQVGHPKLDENNQVREVQPELRQMVFKRDEYTCIKCGKHQDELLTVPLHCHHIEGIQHNPIESADIDMCVTVCKTCHNEIHQENGCGYNDMKCDKKTQLL